jgi:lysophospholipase L1-like esterase
MSHCHAVLRRCCLSLVLLVLMSASNPTSNVEAGDAERVTFVLAGDSTVTDEAGWGHGFAELLNPSTTCLNLAKSGRSSRSYRTEGWWWKCLDAKPQYLLIQFGHNDQPGKGPQRESAADSAFRDHLRAFIDEARAQGIQPVLITSLTRRRWSADGRIEPTLAEYAAATAIVAAEKGVPLIDLHALSILQCEQLGPDAYRAFEPKTEKGADHTHLNAEGSRAVGAIVASALISTVPATASMFAIESINTATIPQQYSSDLTQGSLQLEETAEAITIRQAGRTVLVYNKLPPAVPKAIDPVYARSGNLHPIASPAGRIVTEAYPADHAHQSGLFSAWVRTTWMDREIDFWNLAGGTGRVLHQRIVRTFADDGQIGFETDLVHRAEQEPVIDILRERWTITALETDGTYHAFDLQSTQHALTDKPLLVQKYHYGGMALRGPTRWLTRGDSDAKKNSDEADSSEKREPSTFLNDLGSDRLKGNHEHARWVSLTGQIDGQPVTITVLCHRDNFRSPQAARIHPTKPYFVFSPCVDDAFVIDRDHPFKSRYRCLITDAAPDPEWLNEQWETWCRLKSDR